MAARPISRRSFTTEARARSQESPCEICGGHSSNGTVLRVFPVLFHQWSMLIFILILHLPKGQAGKAWATSNKTKQCALRYRQALNSNAFNLFWS